MNYGDEEIVGIESDERSKSGLALLWSCQLQPINADSQELTCIKPLAEDSENCQHVLFGTSLGQVYMLDCLEAELDSEPINCDLKLIFPNKALRQPPILQIVILKASGPLELLLMSSLQIVKLTLPQKTVELTLIPDSFGRLTHVTPI